MFEDKITQGFGDGTGTGETGKADQNIDVNEFIPGAMGERIAWLRKRKRMTQAQVAERLGITSQAVSKWESGLSCPDIMTLAPLAQVLGVTTDELLGVKPPRLDGGEQDPAAGAAQAFRDQQQEDSDQAEEWKEEDTGTEPFGQNRLILLDERGAGKTVRALSVGAGTCAVVIRAGDKFSLETAGYQDDEVVSEMTADGTWEIRDVSRSLSFISRNAFLKRKMTITIPAAYHFEAVKLSIGAGMLNGSGIHANQSTLCVGAGQMTVKNFYSGGSTIKCGMGEINIHGELYGRCTVDCGMGAVKAKLKKPAHYGYQTSIGMGEVRIGDNRQSGIGGNQMVNADDENFYKISCSMGSVAFTFQESSSSDGASS